MEHVSIWGTPFPAILNQKNSTGSAGGAKNSQNWVFLEVPKYPHLSHGAFLTDVSGEVSAGEG